MGRCAFVLASLLCGLLAACAAEAPPSPPARVIVLGLDGVDPEAVDLLIAEGKLPHFERLRREGAWGPLHVEPPLLSPVIWTSIATGKQPEQHGIGHFTAVLDEDGREVPVTSRMRRVKALWNVFSEAGRRVAVVGWWATWPAEEVLGTVVSDHVAYHFLSREAGGAGSEDGLVSPAAAAARLLPLARNPAALTAGDLAPFARLAPDELARPFSFGDEVSHLRWAVAAAHAHRDIGLALWQSEAPELLLVYVEGVDSLSHLFGHLFRQQGLAGELAAQHARFGGAVEAAYALADSIVGDFLAAMDERSTLIVLSDHGFALGELPEDPSKTRDLRRVSERYHRDRGILFLHGRGIRGGARLAGAGVLDIAPTVLALAGLPQADDMPGHPLAAALSTAPAAGRVATYEGAGQPTAAGLPPRDEPVEQAVLERLKSLGYLGQATSTGSDRNLAFLLLRERRYQEAAEAFAPLVAGEPADAALLTGLASALGGLGREAEAFERFAAALAADPLFVPAYHNRAVLYERLGRREEAVEQYRAALRYDPAYEPSRRALERLAVPLSERGPATPEEERAARLLAEAFQAMRRGDYAGAEALLEEARGLAPAAAAVHHQIANVAYLQGDRARAIEALERALSLEPDNALFRHNLERLRRGEDLRRGAGDGPRR